MTVKELIALLQKENQDSKLIAFGITTDEVAKVVGVFKNGDDEIEIGLEWI